MRVRALSPIRVRGDGDKEWLVLQGTIGTLVGRLRERGSGGNFVDFLVIDWEAAVDLFPIKSQTGCGQEFPASIGPLRSEVDVRELEYLPDLPDLSAGRFSQDRAATSL